MHISYGVMPTEIGGQWFVEHVVGTDATRFHFLVPLETAEESAANVAEMVRKAASEARRKASGLVVPSELTGGGGASPRR